MYKYALAATLNNGQMGSFTNGPYAEFYPSWMGQEKMIFKIKEGGESYIAYDEMKLHSDLMSRDIYDLLEVRYTNLLKLKSSKERGIDHKLIEDELTKIIETRCASPWTFLLESSKKIDKARPTFLLFSVADVNLDDLDSPVGALVKVKPQDLINQEDAAAMLNMGIYNTFSLRIEPDSIRWLSKIGVDRENKLADVPGFFNSNSDAIIYMDGLIDSEFGDRLDVDIDCEVSRSSTIGQEPGFMFRSSNGGYTANIAVCSDSYCGDVGTVCINQDDYMRRIKGQSSISSQNMLTERG